MVELSRTYKFYYLNLSLGAIGIIGNDGLSENKLEIFGTTNATINFIVKRTIYVCMQTTYYTFCMRNKGWEYPEFLYTLGSLKKNNRKQTTIINILRF